MDSVLTLSGPISTYKFSRLSSIHFVKEYPCQYHKLLITSLTTTTPVVYKIYQHNIFNMESRHLLNLSVQNALDSISENFNLKNFPRGSWARNSLEKCTVRNPDGPYCHCTPYLQAPSGVSIKIQVVSGLEQSY